MRIAIDILEEQIKIMTTKVKNAHYPLIIEPFIQQRIKSLEDAVKVLENILKSEQPKNKSKIK